MKIYIISTDIEKSLECAIMLKKLNDALIIANNFTTDYECASIDMSNKYSYYISETQLNLDFKNNSLLYVLTNSENQNSIGMSLYEFYNADIIPISILAFNTIKEENLRDSLIVWMDVKMNRNKYSTTEYQTHMIESKYLMNSINKFEDCFMYFGPNECTEDCISIINEYINADDDRKVEIIKENQ